MACACVAHSVCFLCYLLCACPNFCMYAISIHACMWVCLCFWTNLYGIQHLGAIHVEVQFVLLSIIEVSTASETLKLQVRMHVYMLSHFYARWESVCHKRCCTAYWLGDQKNIWIKLCWRLDGCHCFKKLTVCGVHHVSHSTPIIPHAYTRKHTLAHTHTISRTY